MLVALFLLGCGGGSGGGGGDAEELPTDIAADADSNGLPNDSAGDVDVAEDVLDDGSSFEAGCNANWEIEVFNFEDGLSLEVGKKYSIQARLFNPVMGTSVGGEIITFALEGDGDATLVQTEDQTSEFGIAETLLDAGTLVGKTYEFTVSHKCAGSDSATFHSIEPQSGTIKVTVSVPPEVFDLTEEVDLKVYVDSSAGLCAMVDLTDPSGMEVSVTAEGTATATNLLVGPGYAVTALARSPDGLPVAAACKDKVVVLTGKETAVDLTLAILRAEASGTYDFDLVVPVSTALGPLGPDPAVTLADLYTGVPAALAAAIEADLAVWFPEGWPEDCGDVHGELVAGVAAGLGEFPPAAVKEIYQWDTWAGLEAFLSEVRISGKLVVADASGPDAYTGTLTYQGMEYSGGEICFFDGCSDALVVTQDEFDQGDVQLDFQSDTIEFSVTGKLDIVIMEKTLSVSLGRIALRAFTKFFLYAYPHFSDLVGATVNCGAVTAGIKPETAACIEFNAPQTDIAGSCEAYKQTLPAQFYGGLSGYTAQQGLAVSGSGILVDLDDDLTADGLQGVLQGLVKSGGADGVSMDVPLDAKKQ